MKILILSANTGNGHNAAAKAIGEALTVLGAQFEIVDALALISARLSRIVSLGHNFLYRRHPRLFGLGYRFEERHKPRLICHQCGRGAQPLGELLAGGGFDAVICVHVFAALMLSALRRQAFPTPPSYFVATDYTCSPGVAETCMDLYCIPHSRLLEEFLRAGIPRERILVSGIPVSPRFCCPVGKDEARRRLRLPQDGRVVLLGCGSMGCGRLEVQARQLLRTLPEDSVLVVLCGTNKRLLERLLPLACRRLRVLAFTDQLPLYLAAADLDVTKAGGLSTSEALACGVPLVCVDAIDGLETRNFDFLVNNGLAYGVRHWHQLSHLASQCLSNPPKAPATSNAPLPHAAEAIARRVLERP